MPRAVRRAVGFVEFESLAVAGSELSPAPAGESFAGVLNHMRRRVASAKGKPSPRHPAAPAEANSGSPPAADAVVDADCRQLARDLHSAVSQLVGDAYGLSGNRRPR